MATFVFSGVTYASPAVGTTAFALTSDGGNAIGYLSQDHIYVYSSTDAGVTWSRLTAVTEYTFNSQGTEIVLVTGTTAGQQIRLQRKTPLSAQYVTFSDGSLLASNQLNEAELFSLYCDQELADGEGNITPPDIGLSDTDDLPEGSVNLYYTDARVETYVSGEGYFKGTPGDGTITINQGGVKKGEFTVDQSGNTTIDLDAGGGGGGGVTKIIAGSNIGISPTSGVGEVTITAAGGGGGEGGIPEAPSDGNYYARKDQGWALFTPGGGGAQVQSDWNVSDSSSLAFIKNKPDFVDKIIDQKDFAYAPISNAVVFGANTYTDLTPSEPGAWKMNEVSAGEWFFIWGMGDANDLELRKIQTGDTINVEWGNGVGFDAPVSEGSRENSGSPTTSWYLKFLATPTLYTNETLKITSARIANGTEPLKDGDVMQYDVNTQKWTAGQISINHLAALP